MLNMHIISQCLYVVQTFFNLPVDVKIKQVSAQRIKDLCKNPAHGLFYRPNEIFLLDNLDEKTQICVLFHELSHYFSYQMNTMFFTTYNSDIPWTYRREENKAEIESEFFVEYFYVYYSKRPLKAKEKQLKTIQRKWKEYLHLQDRRINSRIQNSAVYQFDPLAIDRC